MPCMNDLMTYLKIRKGSGASEKEYEENKKSLRLNTRNT